MKDFMKLIAATIILILISPMMLMFEVSKFAINETMKLIKLMYPTEGEAS